MVKSLLSVVMLVFVTNAQNITVSKNSLKIYNNPVSSFADEIRLQNQTAAAVDLDSAFLLVDEMDTTGSGAYGGLGERFYIRWKLINPVRCDMWSLDNFTADTYRLKPSSSSSSIRPSLYFAAPGDSLVVGFVEIGTCLGCSGIPTWYPPYFRGRLQLHFDNGQVLIIRLDSDDMRKFLPANQPCADYPCDSVNVRRILDRNGMETVPVSNVANKSGGRVTTLQLNYNLASAVSLPKPCTMIPDEIGNLTALSNLSAGGNAFDSFSNRISGCINLQTIYMNNNGIKVLPDSIVNCISLKSILLDNNQLTRLSDSIGKLINLRSLSVAENLLTSLPESIVELDSVNCIFIEGNKICTLPDTVIAWMDGVQAKTHCARWEPTWPDSQKCDSVGAERIPASKRLPGFAVGRIIREGDFITVELGPRGDAACRIEIFDLSGKRMETINLPAGRHAIQTVRLNAARYPAGLYHLKVSTPVSNGIIRSFVIER